MPQITNCLWFDAHAGEAAEYYCSVFPNSEITSITYYPEYAHMPSGTVLTAEFRINDTKFVALNGGSVFGFNEGVSFQVDCADQAEVDYYWDRFVADGGEEGQCGWLKDKYGLSWQIVPSVMPSLLGGADAEAAARAMQAMMTQKKIVIAEIQRAYDGT